MWCSGRLTCSSKGAGSGYAITKGTEVRPIYAVLEYDSFSKAKEECCRYCSETFAPRCAAYYVTKIKGGCPIGDDDYSDEDCGFPKEPFVACIMYEKDAKISKCGDKCPEYTTSYGYPASQDPKDSYVGVTKGTPSKCNYFGPDSMNRDYTFLEYKGVNGFAYKGFKSKNTWLKTVKKISSVKKCFEKCRDTNQAEPGEMFSKICYSYTYDTKKKTCRMNYGSFLAYFGEDYSNRSIKFCKSSDRYVTGYWVDMYD